MPKGAGGGTIKTPSLTAAITGTAGKVSSNIIAIVEGVVKLVPSGMTIHAGEFARRNVDGTITVGKFDPARQNDGVLVSFNGPMPGFEEALLQAGPQLPLLDLRFFETLQRTQNLPSSIDQFFPTPSRPPVRRDDDEVSAPRPTVTPPTNNNNRPPTSY